MTTPRDQPTEFAPRPLRRGRRGDVAPSALVALVVLGIAVAIVKPWQGHGAASASSASATAGASDGVDGESQGSGPTVAAPTWAEVGPRLAGYDLWGVRAVTSDQGYHELWQPATRSSSDESATVVIAPGTARVVALGVTFPPDETPLDVRAWLGHGTADPEWLDTRPLNQLPGEGGYLLLRPGGDSSTVRPWTPGRYQLDVLVGNGIRRIDVEIRNASGVTPPDQPWNEPALDVGRLPGFRVGPTPESPTYTIGIDMPPPR